MNIIVQRWQSPRFLEQLVVRLLIHAILEPILLAKKYNVLSFFFLFSFLRIAFIPGSSIELSSIFSVVFYTDIYLPFQLLFIVPLENRFDFKPDAIAY